MEKTKVAVVVPNLHLEGAQNIVVSLTTNVNKEKINVKLIVLNKAEDNRLNEQLKTFNVQTYYYGNKNKGKIHRKIKQYIWLAKVLNKEKPDIVHSNIENYFSWLYAVMYPVKIIVTFHSQAYRMKNPWTYFCYRLLQKRGKIIPVFLAEENKKEFEQVFRIKSVNGYVVPNAIDVSRFKFPERIYKNDHAITFIFVARFHPVKNHHFLISIFSKLIQDYSNVQLKLVGTGHLMAEERKYVYSLGIESNVEFIGEMEDTSEILKEADIAVIPSKSEAFPLVLVEAMASGLPVIVSDVGGMSQIVRDNGIKCTVNNEQQFLNAMKRLIMDEQLRKAMGEKGAVYAEEYSINTMVGKYEKIYETEGR